MILTIHPKSFCYDCKKRLHCTISSSSTDDIVISACAEYILDSEPNRCYGCAILKLSTIDRLNICPSCKRCERTDLYR